jgi:hypothetical protein
MSAGFLKQAGYGRDGSDATGTGIDVAGLFIEIEQQ